MLLAFLLLMCWGPFSSCCSNCCWVPCFCWSPWCCRPAVAFIPAVAGAFTVAVVPAVDGVFAVASFPAYPVVPMLM
jgi:hypothetical protein